MQQGRCGCADLMQLIDLLRPLPLASLKNVWEKSLNTQMGDLVINIEWDVLLENFSSTYIGHCLTLCTLMNITRKYRFCDVIILVQFSASHVGHNATSHSLMSVRRKDLQCDEIMLRLSTQFLRPLHQNAYTY